MADTTTRRYPLGNHSIDIQQILLEAQNRWLRPAEICEILRNYHRFKIAPEPAHKPPSGSLFLFDRKVLRYFRKDGHNWRKKKDGKTVKEAHERLKTGSVDVLHCYYAHGEDNDGFQRRSYWLLEEELSHIVLVHYRRVKGNRLNNNHINEYEAAEESIPNSEMETSVSSNFHANSYPMPTHTMDTVSMNSVQASENEDAESAYSQQASSQAQSFFEVQRPAVERINTGSSGPASSSGNYEVKSALPGFGLTSFGLADKVGEINGAELGFESSKLASIPTWEDVFRNYSCESGTFPVQPPFSSQSEFVGSISNQGDELLGNYFVNSSGNRDQFGKHIPVQEEWQNNESGLSHPSKWAVDHKFPPDSTYNSSTGFNERELDNEDLINTLHQFDRQENDHTVENDLQIHLSNSEHVDNEEGKPMYHSMRHHLLDGHLREPSLKKLDSFDRWVSKELCDVNEPPVQSSAGAYWDTVGSENGVGSDTDNYHLGPSLSQEQLFSIIDFSPSWVYVGMEVKVLITGRFLKSHKEVEKCKWSCMFGEVEVPAEIISDGILRCYTPLHRDGRVPFYISCSNRVACSEVREFEYRLSHIEDVDMSDKLNANSIENLHMRFGNLLCLTSASSPKYDSTSLAEISKLSNIISPLLKEENDEWDQMLQVPLRQRFSSEKVKEQFVQKLLKEKLHTWLLQKVAEGGKGPSVLDVGGQGVLHFAAALGYDWALEPTIVAGVNVNFRDVNGWTALHWAASCGREHTVASLIPLGAAPGLVTDPTPKYPKGRTPADLAAADGHKGMAGYLAESALTVQLGALDLDKQNADAAEIGGVRIGNNGDLPYELTSIDSMRDSLAAVCKATQAAARIHQVFRVQSFQKKQLKQHDDGNFRNPEECALSLLSVKAHKPDEPAHAAAIRIQNKFRGWKGRKEFLLIRQRIVKIQAHVRGHQVRKNYKTIVWSVGILEKVILRWRRKGSGLRGFKLEALPVPDGPGGQVASVKDDDDDFFREGRRQTEERSQIALARVKSMLQYPEARDQYRRLRNVVTQIQERKVAYDPMNPDSETDLDCLIDLDTLLDDDTFMNQN